MKKIYFSLINLLYFTYFLYANQYMEDYSYKGYNVSIHYFIKLIIGILIIIILTTIFVKIFQKYNLISLNKKRNDNPIKIITSKIIVPGKSLIIVEVEGEKFLIGITKEDIRLIEKLKKSKGKIK